MKEPTLQSSLLHKNALTATLVLTAKQFLPKIEFTPPPPKNVLTI